MPLGDIKDFGVKMEMKWGRYGWMMFPSSDECVGGSLREYGEYSVCEGELMKTLVQPGWVVVEGGANIGALTLVLGQAVGREGLVVGFEPQPILHMIASANMHINGVAEWTKVMMAGVGKERGEVRIPLFNYEKASNYGNIELKDWDRKVDKEDQDGWITVSILPIDDLGLTRCDFVKLDVEGMEKEALEGGLKTITKHWPLMLVECDRKDSGPEVIRYLREIGYTPYWFINMLYSPRNFYGNTNNIFDVQGSFNLLCEPSNKQRVLPFKGLREAHPTDTIGVAEGEYIVERIVNE